jgi:hypothetical protein
VLSSLLLPADYLRELSAIIRVLGKFMMDCYHTPFVIYEHGTANAENVGGMSVAHAHLHCVPCRTAVAPRCPEFDFIKPESFAGVADDYQRYGDNRPYLLLRDLDGSLYLAISESIPSQFFRKRVCDLCGFNGKGDWREYPFIDNLRNTIRTARKYGLQNQSFCGGSQDEQSTFGEF